MMRPSRGPIVSGIARSAVATTVPCSLGGTVRATSGGQDCWRRSDQAMALVAAR
jgi:hypothetical protein